MPAFFAVCLRYSLLALSLWMPLLASAHTLPSTHWLAIVSGRLLVSGNLISLTATTPFASDIAASGSAAALYTVTNIGTIPLTGISTQLTAPDAFSMSSATCGATSPLAVGDSCTISLNLQAPSTLTTLSGKLYTQALPSLDGVYANLGPVQVNGPLSVTPSADSHGNISPDTVQSVTYGGSQSFTATPSSGYSVNAWLLDGNVVQSTGNSYTLNNVITNHTVSVNFATSQFTVTPSVVGNGSISPDSVQPVNYGASVTFTASPDTHYHIQDWSVDGSPQGTTAPSFSLNNVTANHTVAVRFAIDQLTVSAHGDTNGDVTPHLQLVDYDGTANFTALPNTGYHVLDWSVDGVPQGSSDISFSVNNVTAHQTVAVSFAIDQFTVTSISTDTNKGNVGPSSSLVDYGGSIEFTAAPGPGTVQNTHYSVLEWSVDGTVVQSGLTSFTLSNITAAHAVSVAFYMPLMVAVGADQNPKPNIQQSLDEGVTWRNKNIIDANTATNISFDSGTLYDTACTGRDATTVCTAAGDGDPTGNGLFALLAVTRDNGLTWAQVSGLGFPENTRLNTTSCTGSGNSAFCLAAGNKNPVDAAPVLVQSLNGGQTWASASILSLTTKGTFIDSSCTGNDDIVCTVIGFDTLTNGPLLVVGTGAVGSWSIAAEITALPNIILNTTSCTGSGLSAVCVVAGKNTTTNAPFIALSTDGGENWTPQSIDDLPSSGEFKASSCTGSGLNVICTVAGVNNTANNALLMVLNTSSGATWTKASLPTVASVGITLTTTSCTGSGSTALCTAAGQAPLGPDNENAGLLVQSSDGGATWSAPASAQRSFNGLRFWGSHCNTNQTICTAVGVSQILQTIDAGTLWSDATGLGSGTFYASSGT